MRRSRRLAWAPTRPILVLGVIGAAVFVGCSDESSEGAPGNSATPRSNGTVFDSTDVHTSVSDGDVEAIEVTTDTATAVTANDTRLADRDQPDSTGDVELPSVSRAELDRAMIAWVECVEPDLDGSVRVRIDRYIGFMAEYGLPDGSDNEAAINSIAAECHSKTGFEQLDLAYRSQTPVDMGQLEAVRLEVYECADLHDVPATYDEADRVTDRGEVEQLIGEMFAAADGNVSGAFLDCAETAIYGPEVEF